MLAISATFNITTYKVAGIIGAAIVVHVCECPSPAANFADANVLRQRNSEVLHKSWHGREFQSGC
jgi:hypothetical protein